MGSNIHTEIEQVIQAFVLVLVNWNLNIAKIHHKVIYLQLDVPAGRSVETPAQVVPVDLGRHLVVAERLVAAGHLGPIAGVLHVVVNGPGLHLAEAHLGRSLNGGLIHPLLNQVALRVAIDVAQRTVVARAVWALTYIVADRKVTKASL